MVWWILLQSLLESLPLFIHASTNFSLLSKLNVHHSNALDNIGLNISEGRVQNCQKSFLQPVNVYCLSP